MKKTRFALVLLLALAPGQVFAAEGLGAVQRDLTWFGTSGYMGYGWASYTLADGTPVTSINLDGIPTSIDACVGTLKEVGPFAFGARGEIASATYITGFIKDVMGAEHDQGVIELTADGIAAFTAVPWLFPYVFAGGTAGYYAVFDPVHPAEGADEATAGLRAGAGVSVIAIRFPVKGGAVRVLLGPEVMTGVLFLQDLFYTYLRVHGLFAVQFVPGT